MEFYKDWQMRLIEIDLGKYEEYIYFFIEKNRAYFNAYQEQIFPFDMEYIPSLLWLLASFAETTIKIFDDLDEKTEMKFSILWKRERQAKTNTSARRFAPALLKQL